MAKKIAIQKKEGLIAVVATAEGYYQNKIHRPGEEFEVEEHELGSWMDRLDGKANPAAKKRNVAEDVMKMESKTGEAKFPAPSAKHLRKDAVADEKPAKKAVSKKAPAKKAAKKVVVASAPDASDLI